MEIFLAQASGENRFAQLFDVQAHQVGGRTLPAVELHPALLADVQQSDRAEAAA